jgi:hypothetical protein
MPNVLKMSVVVEAGTGLALVLAPSAVATLLLGADLSAAAIIVARGFGVALIALSIACWTGDGPPEASLQALRGMVVYNLGLAVLLAYVGSVAGVRGLLLWPAAALHAVVALLLMRPQRSH